MRNIVTRIVGLGSYLLFLVAALYGISFTLGGLLPPLIALPSTPVIPALLLDVGLIALFGAQHSIMARTTWKRWWTSIVPPTLERSLYVLVASCILLALFWLWRPVSTTIWQVWNPLLRAGIYGLCLVGWGIVVLSTFQIDHLYLFGLRQVWRAIHQQPERTPEFRLPFLYRLVRHPMMSGFLLAFWATPSMTVDRLVFAVGMSFYILIGIALEERGLRREFGQVYETYAAKTPQLFPLPRLLWKRAATPRTTYRYRDSATSDQY